MQSPTSRKARAFTLVELMVSLSIFLVMGGFLFTIINSTATIATSTSSRLDAYRVARECLDLIGKDLRSAVLPYDLAGGKSLQMVVSPTSLDTRFLQPHALFWQTPTSRVSVNGNLAVVGYFVIRDIDSTYPSNNRLQLRRLFVEPEDPAATSKYLIYSTASDGTPLPWYPQTLLEEFSPATLTNDNAQAQKGWVADGVLAMWVRCLDPNGNPITKDADGTATNYSFDSRDSYQYMDAVSTSLVRYPNGKAAALPAFIEVTLVCTSPREASRITALPVLGADNPANYYTEIDTFTKTAIDQNPQAKSIESFSRKFRVFAAP